MAEAQRDTDADWRELGATQPYWGVLTHPDYRTENLTAERLDAFYASGEHYIAEIARQAERLTGRAPAGPSLDFGCGAGRLTEPMAAIAGPATGFDISPGMLAEARKRGGAATYVDQLPDGPFGWINSFIVFQHIPPARGLALVADLLRRLAPGGLVSLQLTIWREPGLQPRADALGRVVRAWRRPPPRGAISMYDYDLSAVMRLVNQAGISDVHLIATDHGGHHGVILLGRRAEEAAP